MVANEKHDAKCVTKGCCNKARSRGLCERCYQHARRLIREGKIKGWQALISQGLAKDTRSPFRAAIEKVKATRRTRSKAV